MKNLIDIFLQWRKISLNNSNSNIKSSNSQTALFLSFPVSILYTEHKTNGKRDEGIKKEKEKKFF